MFSLFAVRRCVSFHCHFEFSKENVFSIKQVHLNTGKTDLKENLTEDYKDLKNIENFVNFGPRSDQSTCYR